MACFNRRTPRIFLVHRAKFIKCSGPNNLNLVIKNKDLVRIVFLLVSH